MRQQNRGLSISYDNNCEKCHRSVLCKDSVPLNDIIVFKCGHVFHEACVPGRRINEYCGICSVKTDDDSD